MAEERIPLDLTSAAGHAAAGQLQKQSLRSGNYATPMTPFSPFEGGGGSNSPFARVDSMGVKGDTLPSVSLQGHVWCCFALSKTCFTQESAVSTQTNNAYEFATIYA